MAGSMGKAYWYKHIAKQAESSLNLADYCKLRDLNLGTFRSWVYRQREEQKTQVENQPTSMSFVEVSTSCGGTQQTSFGSLVRLWVGPVVSLELTELRPPGYVVGLAVEVQAVC